MKLVIEDEYGAYSGVTPEFLRSFVYVETNNHFDVLDSDDGLRRFIAVKSSRIPFDENPAVERFGIDFNRRKPTFEEAVRYAQGLPKAYQWQSDIAFAASDEKEYKKKVALWDRFYSFIWGRGIQSVWVAPHSGNVESPSQDALTSPKTMIDSFSAGIAARCALKEFNVVSRTMLAVHSTGQLGAVLNLGDFGILNPSRMEAAAAVIEPRYQGRSRQFADDFTQDFSDKTMQILKGIQRVRGTLNPEDLRAVSRDDSLIINIYLKCLKRYEIPVEALTIDAFKRALTELNEVEVPLILNNFIYPARKVGRILKLAEKIEQGLLQSALCIEGARVYMEKDPDLVSDAILDIKRVLFE